MASNLAVSVKDTVRNLPKGRFAAWCLMTLLQAVSLTFFVGDVAVDFMVGGLIAHTVYEGIATIALFLGVIMGALELFRMTQQAQVSQTRLIEATRSFTDAIRARFKEWSLTPAEADVALLLLKGYETSEIAALRTAAEGTVRAQLSKIYEKAGVNNRGRFVSAFVELLIEAGPMREG